VVVAVGLTLTPLPLVTEIFPGVMTPAPLENTPVRVLLAPAVIVAGLATKLVMVGTLAVTVTVAVCVTAVPVVGVTVRV
jgi:hypothetical protein